MKKLINFSLLFFSFALCYAQQASDYFTVDPGYRWEFISTPLDSLSNEIDSLKYCRWDLFISETGFEGQSAKILQTKSGPSESIAFQPYVDSIFYHFSGANGNEYFKLGVIKNLVVLLDSVITDTTFNVLSFFQSLEQWYSVYRFAQTIGDEYTIFQIDTTITIDTLTLPLRLEYLGERLQDETISTGIGTLGCKKFMRTIGISYLIVLPLPFPPISIPILYLNDYVWIAENYWIVQGLIPPTNVDLQFAGYGAFYIPGLITRLDKVTAIEDEIFITSEYALQQNYPNPFNPTTAIKFSISSPSQTTLKIFNALGEVVTVLVNKELNTGSYKVEWNASSLPSGIYFYQLKTDGFVETKKMILMK